MNRAWTRQTVGRRSESIKKDAVTGATEIIVRGEKSEHAGRKVELCAEGARVDGGSLGGSFMLVVGSGGGTQAMQQKIRARCAGMVKCIVPCTVGCRRHVLQ